MSKALVAIIILAAVNVAQKSNSINSFPAAFKRIVASEPNEQQYEAFFQDYGSLLSADDRVIQSGPKPTSSHYPLYGFKNTKLYQGNIDKLLASPDRYHRLLAATIIGASGDVSRELPLLKIIKSNDEPDIIISAGMSLMALKTRHTTELFDFLVKYEDFGDAHMIPFYFGLDPSLLQKTAYQRIGAPDDKQKKLAAQSLSVTSRNPETERVLKRAVEEWDLKLKGYAIYSMAKLRIGGLLSILAPLSDIPELRGISLAALANSPTPADRDFVIKLVGESDAVSVELLEALFRSESTTNIRVWFKALYSKTVPRDYFIWQNEQPLLLRDGLLPDLQVALQKVNNPKILEHLVGLLKGRKDSTSIDILLKLMDHADGGVRYFAASAAKGNSSPRLRTPAVKNMIKKILESK